MIQILLTFTILLFSSLSLAEAESVDETTKNTPVATPVKDLHPDFPEDVPIEYVYGAGGTLIYNTIDKEIYFMTGTTVQNATQEQKEIFLKKQKGNDVSHSSLKKSYFAKVQKDQIFTTKPPPTPKPDLHPDFPESVPVGYLSEPGGYGSIIYNTIDKECYYLGYGKKSVQLADAKQKEICLEAKAEGSLLDTNLNKVYFSQVQKDLIFTTKPPPTPKPDASADSLFSDEFDFLSKFGLDDVNELLKKVAATNSEIQNAKKLECRNEEKTEGAVCENCNGEVAATKRTYPASSDYKAPYKMNSNDPLDLAAEEIFASTLQTHFGNISGLVEDGSNFLSLTKCYLYKMQSETDSSSVEKLCLNETPKGDAGFFKLIRLAYKNLDKKNPCGLTEAEYAAIRAYTSEGYSVINNYLRTHKGEVSNYIMLMWEKYLNQGLKKIAPFKSYVVRSANLPKEIIDMHKPGATVEYDAFTSTSTNGIFGIPSFVIYGKNGVYIAPISTHESEKEVLFPSHTKFKILYNSCMDKKNLNAKPKKYSQNYAYSQNQCKVIMEETE